MNTYVILQYNDIQDLRQYLVSYHHINIMYFPATLQGAHEHFVKLFSVNTVSLQMTALSFHFWFTWSPNYFGFRVVYFLNY